MSLFSTEQVKLGLVTLALSLSLAAPVVARVFENANEDYTTAMQAFRQLADQGNAEAQWNLGLMYKLGEGVPQDYAEAVKWFRKAADQGDPDAQQSLGLMYSDGQGVPQDYVQAHKWFNLAAARASRSGARADAIKNRDLVAAKMTPEQIAEAQKLAREWEAKMRGGK